jgi:ceramide glucosyltransferase
VTALALIAALLALLGLLQCVLGLIAVRHFANPPTPRGGHLPAHALPVTILKPLCGSEPLLEEALESCFSQAYPEFQIVFGIQDPGDPALEVVERVRSRHPACDIRIVVDSTMHGPNRKVSNLINMLPFARHEILVISDSDLHLPPNYLERLVSKLEKPGVGLVTSLYIGLPSTRDSWAAALGATQISHHFLPGVLLSRAMGRQDCLGSTAMIRFETLQRAGGFQTLVQLLAEDNVMGQRVRDLGLSIELADIVPAATVPEPAFAPLWHHEIRWTRTIRELAPVSLCASTLQYPLFWSMLAALASGAALWSLLVFLACWMVRVGCAWSIDAALRPRVGRAAFPTPVWIAPLRDILSVAEIVTCFWVNEVTWRGHRLGASGVAREPLAVLALPDEPDRILQEN